MKAKVKEKFKSYPVHVRPYLERLRTTILDVANNTEGVGPLEETLKWGEPSYLTSKSKSGTTIRIDWKAKRPHQYALYVNCKTSLIDRYKTLFPELSYEGNRAIIFDLDKEAPENELRACILMALRYHVDKRPG